MRIRATASATARSNAVGVVEIDCTPHGLLLGFLGVGSFAEGYAPAALATGVQLTVPWRALKQARAEGDQVYLELEWPGLPHDRLTLTRFSLGNSVHPLELRRQRWILQLGAVGAAVLASIVAAAVVPRLTVMATAGVTLSVGLAAALAVLAVGFLIDQRLLGTPLRETAVRSAFLAELQGYFPGLIRSAAAPRPPLTQRRLPDLAGLLPRTVMAIAITLAAGIVTAVGTARHLLRPVTPPAAVADLPAEEPDLTEAPAARGTDSTTASPRPAAGPPPTPPPDEAPRDGLVTVGPCTCSRASSPLWDEPIPTLSVLVLDAQQHTRRDRTRTQLDVAVVNNGAEPLEEITLHVRFFDASGKERQELAQRPLYFAGPLGPGRAIKWRTEAKGGYYEVDRPDFGKLELDGSTAAPVAAFRELLGANHRPVRLHAARMLAFLGDPSAAQATLQLKDALRSAEGPYLRRLMAALADIRVCDARVLGQGAQRTAEACIYNATDQDRGQLGLQLVALDRGITPDRPLETPPALLGERKWQLPEPLLAHTGSLVRTPVDLASLDALSAQAFEMHADRFDLLD